MKSVLIVIIFLIKISLFGQSVLVSGSISDDKNNRKLDEVLIEIYNQESDGFLTSTYSDQNGKYAVAIPKEGNFLFRIERQAYYIEEAFLSSNSDNFTHDIKLTRLPGYEFEATVKELLSYKNGNLGRELKNTKIEIYNNTSDKEIVIIEDDPDNTFKVNFERNNHYTILLRKKGYFAKRIEVFVDVEGCILCFEGLGTYASPEIESALTENNQRGSIITDIAMKKIIQDENIALDNIYYDYDKWFIRKDARPALENLVRILKRNPIIVELGSHTDSRGEDEYNMTLSDKRAEAAVDYIVSRGIKSSRITAKGYGESKLLNKCSNDVKCTDGEHQENRRTEFKVTAFIEESNFDNKSLKEILRLEKEAGSRLKETINVMEK